MNIHETIAAEIPQFKRGLVWCTICDSMQRVNAGESLRRGWPTCCDQPMTVDSPEERKTLSERRAALGA